MFTDPIFLRQHILNIAAFYFRNGIDTTNGGYVNCFLDDGTVCDFQTKHLVGISRLIYVFSIASLIGNCEKYRIAAEHGLRFLQDFQRDREHGGFYWLLTGQTPKDQTKYAYGHAFALLAAATAYKSGIDWAEPMIDDIYDVLEHHFWREQDGLYVDIISNDWSKVSPYRG
jgi:mannose/cellobiose epimerase-like protein (N-acyl-D-glucosamine 2-epimerase family)